MEPQVIYQRLPEVNCVKRIPKNCTVTWHQSVIRDSELYLKYEHFSSNINVFWLSFFGKSRKWYFRPNVNVFLLICFHKSQFWYFGRASLGTPVTWHQTVNADSVSYFSYKYIGSHFRYFGGGPLGTPLYICFMIFGQELLKQIGNSFYIIFSVLNL